MATSFLQIDNLTKSYGDRMLFDGVTFGVYEGDKIGVIAKNGTGKSTLLNIIAGIESADSGDVTFRNGLKVGILEQTPRFARIVDYGRMPARRQRDVSRNRRIRNRSAVGRQRQAQRGNTRHGRRIGMGLRGQDEAVARPTESARHNGVDRQSFGRTGQEWLSPA